jgi:uncharacterized protein
MKVAITGASGLVGSALTGALAAAGHRVIKVVRAPKGRGSGLEVHWDPDAGTIDAIALRGADAVVHLAGYSISKRWTPEVKALIRESRIKGTGLIARTVAGLDPKPRVLVCASACGIYGDRGKEMLNEESAPGKGFLADVAVQWEAAAQPARDAGVRVVNTRFGIILAPDGGALKAMRMPFQTGLGAKFGSGRQWWPWVAIEDVVGAIRLAVEGDALSGPVNVVSPQPVTNAEFTKAMGRALSRPACLSVPKWAVKPLLGEGAIETLLYSQLVAPVKLQQAGFVWQFPELQAALRHELRHRSTNND